MVIRGSLVPDGPDGVGAGQRRQGRPPPSSQNQGSSPCMEAGKERDTPDEETSDWRAVCGRTARTVRREGRRKPSLSLSAIEVSRSILATEASRHAAQQVSGQQNYLHVQMDQVESLIANLSGVDAI